MKRIRMFLVLWFGSLSLHAQQTRLYVFVGEKIEVIRTAESDVNDSLVQDKAYKARYRVLHSVHGDYEGDTIEFEAFDHYGSPAFAEYPHVLLFVIDVGGKLHHVKYQYFDVYRTRDGRWAGDGDPYKHEVLIDKSRRHVNPERIAFEQIISFDLRNMDAALISKFYPAPYYRIEKQRAYALMGNYVEDLFLIKKEGVLKARGLF
jgi:hypothetical protein